MKFNEIKEQVKNIAIEDFCNTNGIKLLGSGRYRRLEDHDSCVIDTYRNNFYWNSKGKNGDIINFAQSYYEVDFKAAVEIISGKNISQALKSNYIPTPKIRKVEPLEKEKPLFKMELDETSEKYSRLFAYLNKTRKLSYSIILDFVNKKLISQDTKGNINFKFIDENNKVHFSKKGTTDKPFNYIDTDADIRGFRYISQENLTNDDITTMYVFESPIDLMSYMDMSNTKNEKSVLISMNGVKHNSVLKNLEDFPNIRYLNLCVDNDSGGNKFTNHIRELQTVQKEELLKNLTITRSLPGKFKDWNERLQYLAEIKTHVEVISKPKEKNNTKKSYEQGR